MAIYVKRSYDLRARIEDKISDCNQSTHWTAFVNNAGTLVHMFSKNGTMTRAVLKPSVKTFPDVAIREMLTKRYALDLKGLK